MYRSSSVLCFLIALNFSPFQSIQLVFCCCYDCCFIFLLCDMNLINQLFVKLSLFIYKIFWISSIKVDSVCWLDVRRFDRFAIWYVLFEIILISFFFSNCIAFWVCLHSSRYVCFCFLPEQITSQRKKKQFPIAFKF